MHSIHSLFRRNHIISVIISITLCIPVTYWHEGLSTTSVFILLLTIALQLSVSLHERALNKIHPLREINLNKQERISDPLHFATIALSSLNILLLEAYPTLCLILISLLWSIHLPRLVKLALGLANKKTLAQENRSSFKAFSPELIIYASGMPGSEYQINQWIDTFEQLNYRTAIVLRKSHLTENLAKTKLKVFYARSHAEVEWLLNNGPRAVFYPANAMENAQALRQYNLIHIFINHGESDKVVNQSKFLMAYDKIFVSGPSARLRLEQANLPLREGQIEEVGRPQAENHLKRGKQVHTSIKRILYAPTWEGFGENANYSSIETLGEKLISVLPKLPNTEIRFKPHPYTGKRKKECKAALRKIVLICRKHNIRVIETHESLYESMNWSDILITDTSSVLSDYLITEKPIILCQTKNIIEKSQAQQAAYTLSKAEDAIDIISSIAMNDTLQGYRKTVREHIFGCSNQSAMDKFKFSLDRSLEQCTSVKATNS